MTKKIRPQSKRGTKAKERPIPFKPVDGEIRRAAARMNGKANGQAAEPSHSLAMAQAAATRLASEGFGSIDQIWWSMRDIQLDEPSVGGFYAEARRRLEHRASFGTMKERGDGSHYANDEVETPALADFGDDWRNHTYKRIGDWPLGDLVAVAMAGRYPYEDEASHPDAWEPLERAMLDAHALELRAVTRALEAGEWSPDRDDDTNSDAFKAGDAIVLLNIMRRRIEVGVEIAGRLREARFGHPCFGGGEKMAARATAKRNGAEHAEGSAES